MEEKKTGKVHGLTLKERKYGKLTGVQDIHSFNENEILLQTEAGESADQRRAASCKKP